MLAKIAQKELPIKVSYAIAKNLAKLEVELKTYNAERDKLVQKYSIKDENDKPIINEENQIMLEPAQIDDWNINMKELLSIENEIVIHQFSIDALEGYIMTPAELMLIDYMIEE